MTDRPAILTEYIEYDRLEKEGKAGKDKIRAQAINLLKDGDFPGIYMDKRAKKTINEPAIYEWIKETYPDRLEEVTQKVLDLEKYESLVKLGVMDMPPKECIITTPGQAIYCKDRK